MTISRTPGRSGSDAQRDVQKHLVPWLRAQPGFRGVLVLGDLETGRSISATFWETEADMEATRAEMAEMRDNIGRMYGTEHDTVEELTVVLLDLI